MQKKSSVVKKIDEGNNYDPIHGMIEPENIYRGENIHADINLGEEIIRCSLWRISPYGAEILLNADQLSKVNEQSRIDVTIHYANSKVNYKGLRIAQYKEEEGHYILGIRWHIEPESNLRLLNSSVDRRKNTRWLCPEEFLPTGTFANNLRFNDFIYYRVLNISKTGFRLITSLRNKFIIPGLEFETTITFPMFGQHHSSVRVMDVRTVQHGSGDYLSVGVKYSHENLERSRLISQYLLQFHPNLDIEQLKLENMLPKMFNDTIEYTYLKTKNEFQEVVNLREKAYTAKGKFDSSSGKSLTDVFDARSRIVIAKHKGKVVGSVRVIFHDFNDSLELEQFIKLPERMPRKDEMVEVSRFCIDPAYQDGDVIFGIMKQLFLVMAQAKRRWIVSFSDEAMFKSFYRRFGAERIDNEFTHSDLNNAKQIPFLFDINAVLNGAKVGPIVWNVLVSDIYGFMYTNGYFKYDIIAGLRIQFYRLFYPLARVFKKKIENKTVKK